MDQTGSWGAACAESESAANATKIAGLISISPWESGCEFARSRMRIFSDIPGNAVNRQIQASARNGWSGRSRECGPGSIVGSVAE
jgi:hypothetical protein